MILSENRYPLFGIMLRLGDDVDVFTALDDVVLAQFQLAVADALTGLEIVFVAVPRADEMRFVAIGLALVEAVLVDHVDNVLRDHAFAGRSALVPAGVAVGVDSAAP